MIPRSNITRIEFVQQQLGHASIKTIMDIYGTPPLDDIQASYEEKIEGLYVSVSPEYYLAKGAASRHVDIMALLSNRVSF